MTMNKAHSPADTTRILKGKTWLFGDNEYGKTTLSVHAFSSAIEGKITDSKRYL
jgi:hypothetical protein